MSRGGRERERGPIQYICILWNGIWVGPRHPELRGDHR